MTPLQRFRQTAMREINDTSYTSKQCVDALEAAAIALAREVGEAVIGELIDTVGRQKVGAYTEDYGQMWYDRGHNDKVEKARTTLDELLGGGK